MQIDSIYEAAILPERWVTVLDALAMEFDALGGMLIRASATSQKSICSPAIEETVRLFEKTPYVAQNVRVERLVARRPHPGFLTDLDLVTEEETRTLPIYTEWLTPHRSSVGAATLIQDGPSASLLMSLEGLPNHAAARRSIPLLDELRPHIARAAMLSARFHFEKMRSAIEALATVGLAGAVLDASGSITAANTDFEGQMRSFIGARGSLRFPMPAQLRFDQGVAQLPQTGISIGLRLPNATFRVLHMVPIRGEARDIFTNSAAFLIVVDPTRRIAPGSGILQSLFDLTLAEALVADSLADGKSVSDIAMNAGTSVETIRTQLKAIFGKTGVNRQADLIAMLRQIGVSEPRNP
jgi:DNA-binding CsgD family transcriptional regulator